MNEEPFVTVLTPVYNGAAYLAECIESVLKQDYKNYEYIIVNNCSTDGSLDISEAYAATDRRIRVYNNKDFVGVIDNHNIAFGLMSPAARYCKVVSADDFIFPECISRLVGCAEANPSAGIVGSYQLSGSYIKWQGFSYPRAVIPGDELCRRIFLGGDRTFGFGTPTSLLYRTELVRSSDAFYPNPSPHADTSACFKYLQHSAFGFVYQVLSYERIHGQTQSSMSIDLNRYSSAYLNDLMEYGAYYLTGEELHRRVDDTLKGYHQFLAVKWMDGVWEKGFWDYHKGRLRELGYPLSRSDLLWGAVAKILREALNPEQAFRKAWKRGSHKIADVVIPGEQRGAGDASRMSEMRTSLDD